MPRGTPRAIIDKLSIALHEISAETSIKARFQVAGARSMPSTPDEVLALAAEERPIQRDMVRLAGTRID